MISVQSLLQLLNGNDKLLLFTACFLLYISCTVIKPAPKHEPYPAATKQDTSQVLTDTIQITDSTSSKKQYLLKDKYNIAVLLPLFYQDFENEISANEQDDDEYAIPSRSLLALEFYEGALIAVDSLKNIGMSLDINVYDTNNDTNRVKLILNKDEFQKTDMIIGPVFNNCLRVTAAYTKKRNIILVSPFSPSNTITNNNPGYFMCNPTINTHCKEMTQFICNNFHDVDLHIISQNSQYEKKIIEKIFKNLKESQYPIDKDGHTVIETDLKVKESELSSHFSLTKRNLIIVPSFSEPFVNNLISQLSKLNEEYNVIVFGMPTWVNFTSLRYDYIERLQMHISNSFLIEKEKTINRTFINQYIKKFKTYPSENAFKGYYSMLYFGLLLKKYGVSIKDHFNDIANNVEGFNIYTFIPFTRSQNQYIDHYENIKINILKYENYSLEKVN